MKIERINTYDDVRFSKKILQQHGAFIVDDIFPCAFEIINNKSALIRYHDYQFIDEIIDEFRFYAEHIINFYNDQQVLLKQFEAKNYFYLDLDLIQPSQFYIDQLKLEAVSSFINIAEDVIIPLGIYNSHYVALDGHTRMYCAYQRGFKQVLGYDAALSAALNGFIIEAQRRNIRVIADLPVLLHQEYEEKWNHYCEEYFKQGNRNGCL